VVDGQRIDALRIVQLADMTGLEHRGSSLLSPPLDAELQEMPREQIELLQGHLEGSNVSPIASLIDMIAAQRAFEVKAKLLSTADEMLAKSVNQLSAIR
jgi:flagellar basal-body rod protein FlgG